MEYIPLIALCVSGIAIIISVVSLWISWRAHHHTQIVSFEQRKQEVRQISMEAQGILGEINKELERRILICEEQVVLAKDNEEVKRKILSRTKLIRDHIAQQAVISHDYESFLEELDEFPSTPSTEARLALEQWGGEAIRMKNQHQTYLKELRDGNQTIEDTIRRRDARGKKV